jgi:hypothetical protein
MNNDLDNWIPYHLTESNGEYTCKWLYTNGDEFTGPFFTESVSKCLSHAFNSGHYRPYSNISVLPEWAANLNSIPPTAFIFHISRCGSTLVSQSLCLNDAHIVLPEAPFIDEILRLTKKAEYISALSSEEMVRATIKIYGQNSKGDKKHLFIKTDSWHIHFIPLLRKLYPNVPFILLYRRPDEVIRSHQKLRGMQAVPGVIPNELLGIAASSTNTTDLDGHMAKVLENYLKTFTQHAEQDPLALLINYNEGIMDIMQRFCSFTGVELNADDWEQIKIRSRFNAKHPHQAFLEIQPDEAIPEYQQQVFEYYEQLEQLKACTSSLVYNLNNHL